MDELIAQWRRERPDIDSHLMVVAGRIRRIAGLVERNLEEAFAPLGLALGGFEVLAALRRAGPPYRLTPTDLYSSLLKSSGAITNRIDRLEEAGLVQRHPDPEDRRGILVRLTPKGKDLVDRAVVAAIETYNADFAPLSAEESKVLATLLKKLTVQDWDRSDVPVTAKRASRRHPNPTT
jgi:DNA-binding MarR family transcriptional regulator